MIFHDSLKDIPILKTYINEFINYNGAPNTDENIFQKQKLKKAFLNKYVDFEKKLKASINGYLEMASKDTNFVKLYRKEILDKLLKLIDENHKSIENELLNISINEDSKSLSIVQVMNDILNKLLDSPEIKYFYRMCTLTIIFEGPDRTGKSTLITFFERFLMSKYMHFIQRNFLKLTPVTDDTKQVVQAFLDLSKQEDRLLFQNKLFDTISINTINVMKENWKLSQNIIMDRSLLSNLIYAYTMLDEEHFAKYLFSNLHTSMDKKVINVDKWVSNLSEEDNYNIENRVKFLLSKFYNIKNFKERHAPTSLKLDKEDSLELENTMRIENHTNGPDNSVGYNNRRTLHFIYNYKRIIEKYTTNILYIKNSIYSYNKLDEIEKNSNQYRIKELFSMFKDKKNIYEFLKMKNHTPDKSIKFRNNVIDYNILDIMESFIKYSFNSISHHSIDIIYDDDTTSSVEDVFNNALNKIIELNYEKYLEDKDEQYEHL